MSSRVEKKGERGAGGVAKKKPSDVVRHSFRPEHPTYPPAPPQKKHNTCPDFQSTRKRARGTRSGAPVGAGSGEGVKCFQPSHTPAWTHLALSTRTDCWHRKRKRSFHQAKCFSFPNAAKWACHIEVWGRPSLGFPASEALEPDSLGLKPSHALQSRKLNPRAPVSLCASVSWSVRWVWEWYSPPHRYYLLPAYSEIMSSLKQPQWGLLYHREHSINIVVNVHYFMSFLISK